MANVEYVFVWNYKQKKLKSGDLASIHLKVYFDRNTRRYIDTGVEVPKEYWDDKKSYISTRHPNYNRLHKILRDLKSGIEDYEQKLIDKKQLFTSMELNKFLSGKSTNPDNFLEFFRNEINSDNTIEHDSKKSHYTTLKNLEEFSNGILALNDINYKLVVDFDRWLREKKLKQNTIHKRHQIVSRYYKRAEKYGIAEKGSNPYSDFKVKTIAGSRTALEEFELISLENFNRSLIDEFTRIVLDRFLFSCYTGLRISDSLSLIKSDITPSDNGLILTKFMEKTDTTTGASVMLPLRLLFAGKPENIAIKYMEENKDIPYLFPPMTAQAVNRTLKVISAIAGIRVPLTFHIARHTFGTALADITMNPYLIMDLMGHRDIKTSMIYIHRSAERTKRQLASVNEWWGNEN
ncbi:MAG: site-specific integrase [Prevotellaceae bacterium]|jgi:integrase|nr:site-specific integrase [Prevotellaceae bacterium]